MPEPASVAVIDFRRERMVLDWHPSDGGWSACEPAPPRVHGVALIRASRPHICIYAGGGHLYFQRGIDRWEIGERATISYGPVPGTLGLRRRFDFAPAGGARTLPLTYWSSRSHDILEWLAAKSADPAWGKSSATRWSLGVAAEALRAECR